MDLGSYGVVNLDVAVGKYAHTRALFNGDVQVAGLELNQVDLPVSTILNEVLNGATWDVSEMSMGRFVQITAKQPTEFVGLPIFPCRAFRHAAFYVLASSKLVPAKLSGCRIGIPGWAVTAVIYARALMMHQWGIPIDKVEWIVGDVDGGNGDPEIPTLPRGLHCSNAQGESLSSLLLGGKIDALISPYAPQIDRSEIRHLVTDHAQQDCTYWETNKVFPIMHAVVLRRDVERRHPGTARRVMEAFTTARDRCIQKLLDPSDMSMPLPFLSSHVERIKGLLGEDFWPYGFEGNRGTLETFLDFCYEQSVSDRRLRLDELFLSS